ncbi:ankyrin repeat domain-containing protein [Paenibacillus aurantius]|uniref:Ankyrin repeat domain-containing protein n=1 Tax=Paenibacillus aurantius TaxID=2918900 RepID=A0AA96LG14_9BACL|nr:ankyrin repeat domain-containing protein [Paenibacillus aurantius]WNQ12363.1 ankyrin repeat domain-containing protein [Paenibacillus aurantius]
MIEELFKAAQSGDITRLKELLAEKPELANTENADGLTPLGYAAHFGQAAAVKLLLEAGAEVNAVSHSKIAYIPSNTALHAAIAGERDLGVIRLLLAGGASASIPDSDGHTALHTAAYHADSVDIIRLLLEHGADIQAEAGGATALALAKSRGNDQVAELLERHANRAS